ncbi:MAG: hypothetical protein L7F77_09545 [Candidatus Magnetominusculus sp. LBB02]|nr:hypothetical protein [Candidatus Magnetominusculus sp. LBB02]
MITPKKKRQLAAGLLFLIPCAYLIWAGLLHRLGADPVEKVIHTTGDWALRFILLAMAARSLTTLPVLKWIAAFHKPAAGAALFYATCHFLTYAAADQNFSIPEIIKDAATHTRLIFGALAYTLIAAAAAAMTPMIIKRIGFNPRLHNAAAYIAATCAAAHYVWLVKKDLRTPLIYAAILAALSAYRAITKVIEVKKPL